MDYYLQNLDRLEGQPKRTIADYVEQNGILVPRRFDSLAEARRSHRGIFLRSEHQQEYDGVSGLLDSFNLSSSSFSVQGSRSMEEVKQKYFAKGEKKNGTELYKQYCKSLGLDENEFRRQTTFSIWEALNGFNRTIIADSSIAGRHHVMTYYNKKDSYLFNYAIVQDGEIEQEFIKPLPEDLKSGLRSLVETYERVRNLGRFNPSHCPIMEFQTHNGKNYFLQYHRTIDFSPSTFTLERTLQNGEIEVPFVRGATSKSGMDCKVTVYYAGEWYFDAKDEDGSFDLHYNWIFPELQSKRRKLQVISARDLDWELMSLVLKHSQRSKMFKPEISAIFPIEAVIRDNEVLLGGYENVHLGNGQKYVPRDPILKDGEEIFNFSKEAKNGKNSYMNLHLVSDGRKAYVKRI